MEDDQWLAGQFERHRPRLRAIAYRMLGSLAEADDAVQDAWLRLSRSDTCDVDNLGGWLTTIVARVCLNMLRSRTRRREEPLEVHVPDPVISPDEESQPEEQVLLADSVGLALLVVLDTLTPDERLAFVLHDMFDLPFNQIAAMTGRTPAAAKQLASRARRRVNGSGLPAAPNLTRQRQVVDAFFAAARHGDFEALVAVLHPDVVLRIDAGARHRGASILVRGSAAVASQAVKGFRQMFGSQAASGTGKRIGRSDHHHGRAALHRDQLHRRRRQDHRNRRDRRSRTRPQARGSHPHRRVDASRDRLARHA